MLVKISAVLLGFFTVALTENLEAINPDGLDPTASHVCSSTISEYYTVSEEYTYYVEHITYTWCFAIPPRCRDVKVQKKTDWRNVVKSRQRKSYYCCNGYESREGVNYCYAKCKDNCNGYGYCIRPDICSCFQGHAGKFCESTCPEGSWGENCNRTCQCSTHGSCDPKHGSCICHIGYTGNDCSTPCQGAFGPHCIYQCRCENNATCDNVDGRCTCAPGYYGVYCHKECPPGTSGEDCEQLECQCQNGGTCDENRECICPDGYTGESCGLMCDDRHWGHNCSNLCYCYNGRCEPENGNCRCEMSYAGDHCQIQCKPGSYGEDCGTTCACQHGGRCYYTDESQNSVSCNCSGTGYHGASCHIRDCDETEYLVAGSCQACNCSWATTSSCNVLTGACQCNPGYKGGRCLENCKMPYFGQDCEETCECKHGDCHHVTGNCTQCYAGYRGVNCDQECPVGTWGVNCSESCTCQNGADCHETTGYCNCTRGFTGLYCAQRCPEGRYGYNCESVCQCNNETSICSRTDGQCQCHSGYYGDYCQHQCPPNQYGFHCLYNCSCSENGTASCNHRTGECNCKAGWKGITCNSQCYEGTWGENCLRTCDCNNHGSCDQLLGHCICYPGYIGPKCSQECPEGRYGFGCQETCQPCSDGAVCDFITGHCPLPGTCPAGFTGATCQELCPDGTWGVSCNESCASTCSGDRGRCNPINGQCRCFPGYTGIDCEHECDPGKYGIACQFRCQCIEESTESCNHKNGQCTCRPGFQGIFCEEQCAAGLWGPGCLFRCSDICNTVGSTGYCDFRTGTPCQCSTGYEGNHCQNQIGVSITEQQKGGEEAAGGLSPIVIAVIVIAVILVLVIVIIVVYYNRRVRKLKNDNLQVEFNANGVGTFDNSPSENHAPAGVLNPTYEAQNLNNEARYPHLSSRSRAAPAPNPPLATKGDQYLDSCSDRRTSGCYDEADEERYTTLKSVTDEPGANGDSLRDTSDVNIQKSRYEPKVSDKYVFYTGPKVPNSAAERSRLPSHDQQLKRDDLMKPNNLHLAQQTTVSNPSPTTSCSSLNDDIEPNDQTSGLSPALTFMNEQFGATTNVKQVHNETDNSKKTNSADSGMGQSVVPNQYTPVPHMSSFSDADPSFETSSGLPENFRSDTTGLLVNSTKPNPYDTPIPREERSDDSMQGTLSDGYLTPSVRSTNPYDTPRTTSLSSNPYDTPRALNPPVTDPEVIAKVNEVIDTGTGHDMSGDSQTGDWVTFNENEESSDQSTA